MPKQTLAEDYLNTMTSTIVEAMEAYESEREIDEQPADEWLHERPLEIVNRRGARFAVVLTVGGPYAAVEADLDADGERTGDALLVVYWGGDTAQTRHSKINDFLDFYAESVNY